MAYKPTEADRNTVKTMAACGVKHEDIARCLGLTGIDDKTLRKHFRQELDTAAARANSVIASRLYAAAERAEPWAVCFWLKTRARWRETSIHEHTGPDGQPIQPLKIEITGVIPRSHVQEQASPGEQKKPPDSTPAA